MIDPPLTPRDKRNIESVIECFAKGLVIERFGGGVGEYRAYGRNPMHFIEITRTEVTRDHV